MPTFAFMLTKTCTSLARRTPTTTKTRVVIRAATAENAAVQLNMQLRGERRSKGKSRCSLRVTGPRRVKGGLEGVAGARRRR